MSKRFYITTPIYYVNDKPHIGHAYSTILADVIARYHRLFGDETFFLTGTDEHGQKVQQTAKKEGITPQQQSDRTVVRFKELWKKLGISNDDFIRTTERRHKDVVNKILQQLFEADDIYKDEYDGWYCVACERFYTEKDLIDGKCPQSDCNREVEQVKESNYFFRMSTHQDWLIDYINENKNFIQPDFRRNETLGFLRNKLNDLCISRPKKRLAWGIELPFDKDYVTYVWFDALVNYISAIGYMADDAQFSKWWPATCHLIGKDILTTHTVYWPTMLRALKLPLPKTIFAHGWWLMDDDKMSKSRGNVVNPMEFADTYGTDVFRYFLVTEMTLGQDSNFLEESFIQRYNTDLANNLGNLLSRVTKLIHDHFQGKVPAADTVEKEDQTLISQTLDYIKDIEIYIEDMNLDMGMQTIGNIVREVNRYLESTKPWILAKQQKTKRVGSILYNAAEILRMVSGLLSPVMPDKMKILRSALGIPDHPIVFKELKIWGKLKSGNPIGELRSLFPRLEMPSQHQDNKKKSDSLISSHNQ